MWHFIIQIITSPTNRHTSLDCITNKIFTALRNITNQIKPVTCQITLHRTATVHFRIITSVFRLEPKARSVNSTAAKIYCLLSQCTCTIAGRKWTLAIIVCHSWNFHPEGCFCKAFEQFWAHMCTVVSLSAIGYRFGLQQKRVHVLNVLIC